MPSKSPAQARLMAAAAHDPKFAKKVGVPQSVAKEFNQADTGTSIRKPHNKGPNQFALRKEKR
jgi:hypothetical protein